MPELGMLCCKNCKKQVARGVADCPEVCPHCNFDLRASAENVDLVNEPPHYKTESGLEAIDVIEAFELNYHLGNVTKYILRAGKKDNIVQDLKKARWYLDRYIGGKK